MQRCTAPIALRLLKADLDMQNRKECGQSVLFDKISLISALTSQRCPPHLTVTLRWYAEKDSKLLSEVALIAKTGFLGNAR